ncbi:MAG: phosphotransferase [Candidatus Rhabdochlamydia sp.]
MNGKEISPLAYDESSVYKRFESLIELNSKDILEIGGCLSPLIYSNNIQSWTSLDPLYAPDQGQPLVNPQDSGKKQQPRFICSRAEDLDFPLESFDCIFSCNALHHVQDLLLVLRKLHAVLKARNRCFPDHPNYFLDYIKCLDSVQKRGILKENFFEEVETKIKKTVEEIDWGALPLSWIHGDPSLDNSIFCRQTSQIFLIDLDDARMGFRVWDLVRALVVVGAFDVHSSTVKSVRKTWDIKPMQWILNGFLKHQKLEPSEIDKFLSLLQLNAILIFISEFDLDDEEFGQCLQDSITEQADKLLQLISKLEVRYLNVH